MCRAALRLASVRVVCSELFGTGMSDLGPIWVRLAPKWDKSGTFSNHISVHFRLPSLNVLKYELKKSRICPLLDHSNPFWLKFDMPVVDRGLVV